MSEFEKWKAKHLTSGELKTWVEWCKEAFKAGQQGNQAIIDDLQNQLKLCREENKGLIKTLNYEKKRIEDALSQIDESRKIHDDPYDVICDVEKALRGENEK